MERNPSNIWIVNHPYHLNDIDVFAEKFPGKNRYIYIAHRGVEFDDSDEVLLINRYQNPLNLSKSIKSMRKSLMSFGIDEFDRIFVFNGQELMNNAVLSFIHGELSKKIIVVDDGTSGYQFYLENPPQSNRWLDKLKILIFQMVFGIKLSIRHIGDLYYYALHPDFVNHLIFPYKIMYNGALKVECILPPKITQDYDKESIVFLSQPFYLPDPGYLTYDEYIILLDKILKKLADKYSLIYFKPHPNDSSDLMNRLHPNSSIKFITSEKNFEEFIEKNHSQYIYSFNSNALLFSLRYGRKTVWLYKLISERCSKDFEYLDNIVSANEGKTVNALAEL